MFCRKCGQKIVDDDLFCGNCGAHIVKNTESKVEEPKIISVEPVEESKEDLVNFLSNEKPKTEQVNDIHLSDNEPKNDLVDFLMNEKPKSTHSESESSFHATEPKNELVDLISEEKPKSKLLEEAEAPKTEITSSEEAFNNELITFTEPEKEKKKSSPVVGIIIGVVCFIVAFLIVSRFIGGGLFNRPPKNIDPSTFETVQLGSLSVGVPPYFKKEQDNTNYIVYSSSDKKCAFGIMAIPNTSNVSEEYLIEETFKGSRDAINGTMSPYTVEKEDINGTTWSFGKTDITNASTKVQSYMYVTSKNSYYGFNYTIQENNATCEAYRTSILSTLKISEQ